MSWCLSARVGTLYGSVFYQHDTRNWCAFRAQKDSRSRIRRLNGRKRGNANVGRCCKFRRGDFDVESG